jgi:hypothetical protein
LFDKESGLALGTRVNIREPSMGFWHFRNGLFATSAVDTNVEIVFVCDFSWFHHGRAFSFASLKYIAAQPRRLDLPDSLLDGS